MILYRCPQTYFGYPRNKELWDTAVCDYLNAHKVTLCSSNNLHWRYEMIRKIAASDTELLFSHCLRIKGKGNHAECNAWETVILH